MKKVTISRGHLDYEVWMRVLGVVAQGIVFMCK